MSARGSRTTSAPDMTVPPTSASAAAAAATLLKRSKLRPTLGVVLGSGFQHVLTRRTIVYEVPYAEIPGCPLSTVPGHEGRLVLTYLAKTPVVILSGRAHFYEGHSMEAVTFAIRLLAALEVKSVLLTNAAGGISSRLKPGDFMYLTDHINLMGMNPLRGTATPGLPRFVDLTETYDPSLARLLKAAAAKAKARVHGGVYLAVSGPSYETPAEIRAFAKLGADAVGMSTVPEAVVARQCGLRVAGLSCITNRAAGLGKTRLSHSEVLATGAAVREPAVKLLEQFAELYAERKIA